MRTYALRLQPGEDLRPALERAYTAMAQDAGTSAACVVSAIGSLTQVTLRYAGARDGALTVAPLELLSLAGTFSPDGAHLHASVADAQGRVLGGHLLPGSLVRTTAEVVIGLLPGWEFRRVHDAATGHAELVVRRVVEPGGF